MAPHLIQNLFPMWEVSPRACSSRSLAAPALPHPGPPNRWHRDKTPPTPSALSAACSKRKNLRKAENKGPRSDNRSGELNWELETASSFVAKSDHRIDLCRPPCGKPRSK